MFYVKWIIFCTFILLYFYGEIFLLYEISFYLGAHIFTIFHVYSIRNFTFFLNGINIVK